MRPLLGPKVLSSAQLVPQSLPSLAHGVGHVTR
jgi:hypothetical protein